MGGGNLILYSSARASLRLSADEVADLVRNNIVEGEVVPKLRVSTDFVREMREQTADAGGLKQIITQKTVAKNIREGHHIDEKITETDIATIMAEGLHMRVTPTDEYKYWTFDRPTLLLKDNATFQYEWKNVKIGEVLLKKGAVTELQRVFEDYGPEIKTPKKLKKEGKVRVLTPEVFQKSHKFYGGEAVLYQDSHPILFQNGKIVCYIEELSGTPRNSFDPTYDSSRIAFASSESSSERTGKGLDDWYRIERVHSGEGNYGIYFLKPSDMSNFRRSVGISPTIIVSKYVDREHHAFMKSAIEEFQKQHRAKNRVGKSQQWFDKAIEIYSVYKALIYQQQ